MNDQNPQINNSASVPITPTPIPTAPVAPTSPTPVGDTASAKKLTIISLCCHYGVSILTGSIAPIADIFGSETTTATVIRAILGSLETAAYIASWITILMARSKDKSHTLSKIFVWIYLGEIILAIVLVIIIIIAFVGFLSACVASSGGGM